MVKDIETGNIQDGNQQGQQDGNQQGQQDGNQQGQQDGNVNSGQIDDIFAQLENTKISIKENLEKEEPQSCCMRCVQTSCCLITCIVLIAVSVGSSVLMYFVLKKWLKVV
nr:10606_t:CDS:2 [Entrophospora candida]